MSPKGKWIERKPFVEQRYENFKNKRMWLDKTLPPASFHLTDLDSYHKSGLLLKDLVLCDRCNENIEDDHFFMLENFLVYHRSCITSELYYYPNPATAYPIGSVLSIYPGGSVVVIARAGDGKVLDSQGVRGDYFVMDPRHRMLVAVAEQYLSLCGDLKAILAGQKFFKKVRKEILKDYDNRLKSNRALTE